MLLSHTLGHLWTVQPLPNTAPSLSLTCLHGHGRRVTFPGSQ